MVARPHTTQACWTPAASRAIAIDAGQSPVMVPARSAPEVVAPRLAIRQPPPGSRHASCTPCACRPWTTSSRPRSVIATRWLEEKYVGSLEPTPEDAIVVRDRKKHTSELQSHSDLVCRL